MKSRITTNMVLMVLLSPVLAPPLMWRACGTENSAGNDAAQADRGSLGCSDSIPPGRQAFPMEDGPVTQTADKVAQGVGKVIAAVNSGREPRLFVFEETHDSRIGQLQIALMLLRLHSGHQVRQVSLEGAMAAKGLLPVAWFHDLTSSKPMLRAGLEGAVRLLKEGEINSAEFLALTRPQAQVIGNELEEEYNVKSADSDPASACLIAIAEKSLTQSQIRSINDLINAKKMEEARRLLFGSNAWINERYEKLRDKKNIVSAEEMAVLLGEIQSKAEQVGARINDDSKEAMRVQINFFKTASTRSCTIVRHTLGMCERAPGAPVALIIGAAHTAKVIEVLKAARASFAVISPLSLVNPTEKGGLSFPAYERKSAVKSVDPAGWLGALLDARHKPLSVLDEQWFKSKSEIYSWTRLVASATAAGDNPPFNRLDSELKKLRSIRIDPSSYEVIRSGEQRRVMFKVTARVDNKDPLRTTELWVGGWLGPPMLPPGGPGGVFSPGEEEPDLEKLIQAAIRDLESTTESTDRSKDPDRPDPQKAVVVQLSTETKAAFSTTAAAVRRTLTSG